MNMDATMQQAVSEETINGVSQDLENVAINNDNGETKVLNKMSWFFNGSPIPLPWSLL